MPVDIFSIINANTKARNDAVLSRQQAQENAFILQDKMQARKQVELESAAVKLFDPKDESSLDRMATALAQGGDMKATMSVMQFKEDRQHQKALEGQKLLKDDAEQAKRASGFLATMGESEESFQTGSLNMRAAGINPEHYGIVGGYAQNKDRLPMIARSLMSAHEQATMQLQKNKDARSDAREGRMEERDIARVQRDDAKARLDERKVELAEKKSADIDKVAELKRSGSETSFNKWKADKQRAKPADVKVFTDIIAADPRVSELLPTARQSLATRVTGKALQKMYGGAKFGESNLEIPDEDAAAKEVLDEMEADGTLPKKDPGPLDRLMSMFSSKAKGPVSVKTKADWAKLPVGTKYTGPDGEIRRKQ